MSSVDVIVPCYRYGAYLAQCVESVLLQAGCDVRVLILDDASPDDTAEVAGALARRDPRVRVVRHATNRGHIATYNEGIEWACADYLQLLSADDYLLPGALARAAGLLDRHREVGFAFGRVLELTEPDATRIISTPAHGPNDAGDRVVPSRRFRALCSAQNIVPTPSAVVRTALQKRVGGYRADLPHAGDMEMWLRLAANAPVGVIGACQAVYRRHSNNMSRQYMVQYRICDLEQRNRAFEAFCETCGHLVPDLPALRRQTLRNLAMEAIRLANRAFNENRVVESNQLAAIACALDPASRRSLHWAWLAWKRWLGTRVWQSMRPSAALGHASADPRER
jgi:glycosyltransferase involved in cell wall biosynthesis